MVDRWEICEVFEETVVIFSPGREWRKYDHTDFARSLGKVVKIIGNKTDIFPCLLEEGWEPYWHDPGYADYFKRKVNSG